MCTEIEAKLKVDSLDEISSKLVELGAEFLGEQLQTDSYFDDHDRTLTKNDRGLRLRQQIIGKEEKVFLTYKGAKEKDNFKKRQEIEIELKNADPVIRLFSALGYEKELVFEKKRQVWQFDECEVALDELPLLGTFVEIEGPGDKEIADVQTKLGLVDLPHIPQSYAGLMEKKLSELGSEQREVFL